ncbi:single-stranded DNA-binding protein [Streptomyces shenzhenensis]|uniref:single-stranded DNA-binding protein n=1 Tax=Streptomyces shenzhenensis TaxID=943815 RepID=UPI00340CDAB6
MSGETTAVIRGRVYGTVQLRHTERGMPAARFTVLQVPREYDRAREQWRDGEPVPVICTVTGPLARHAAECLTDAVHVIATGNLALRDNRLHLDTAQVGVDLAHHVAYIDDTLPSVLAGRAPAPAARATTAPEPAPRAERRPAAAPTAAPASWWQSPSRRSWDAVTAPSRTGR